MVVLLLTPVRELVVAQVKISRSVLEVNSLDFQHALLELLISGIELILSGVGLAVFGNVRKELLKELRLFLLKESLFWSEIDILS